MLPSPNSIYRRLVTLIAVGCGIELLYYSFSRGQYWEVAIVPVVGTLFQHAVLAAAWGAFGPGKLLWRLIFAFSWVSVMGLTLALVMTLRDDGRPMIVMGLVLTLWLGAFIPIWIAASLFGLRLRYQGVSGLGEENHERQFGISQLMMFTAFIAVLLGLGRLLPLQRFFGEQSTPGLLFFLGSQIIRSLPLLFAAFLSRYYLPGVLLSLIFITAVMIVEIPVILSLRAETPFHRADTIVAINVVSAVWALVFAAVVRTAGYHFGQPLIALAPDHAAK